MEFSISSEPSRITLISISGGRVFLIFSISSFTSLAICTVLAPVCLEILIRTDSLPFKRSSSERSLIVSLTVAKSLTKICLPSRVVVTTISFISELSLYSLSTRSWYCSLPILTVPLAKLRLLALMALPTLSTVKL